MGQATGLQIRMARAGLRWSIAELAKHASVGEATIKRIEAEGEAAGAAGREETRDYRAGERAAVLARITKALTDAGATLLADNGDGDGVRVKPKRRR